MSHLLIQGDACRLPLPDRSLDLVLGSPPYCDARTYGIGAQRDCAEWVEWMLKVTTEAVRVSRGLVLWVCAGVTRDHCYWPACEGLLWEWWKRGGQCWRPAYWHRVGIPGSGGKKWLRADVEYVLCFKGPGVDFWTDNTAMGHPPKWAPGGEMSHRLSDGSRVNQWGMNVRADGTLTSTSRGADGGGPGIDTLSRRTTKPSHRVMNGKMALMATESTEPKVLAALDEMPAGAKFHTKRTEDGDRVQVYIPPAKANPGTYQTWDFAPDEDAWHEQAVVHVNVGGGRMGTDLAHENEAPYPEAMAEFFVRSFCPPGGIVGDPFSGSGTTAAVAEKHDRHAIGIDLRRSMCELGARRIADGMRPVSNLDVKTIKPLAGQQDLFARLDP